jgi:hypothetical protein
MIKMIEKVRHSPFQTRSVLHIKINFVPRNKHTSSRLLKKTNQLMLYREMIPLDFKIYKKNPQMPFLRIIWNYKY